VGHYKGRIVEILLEAYQNGVARISAPAAAVPRAGQYLQVYKPADELAALPISVFRTGEPEIKDGEARFAVSGEMLSEWTPGEELALRGPFGRGFELPARARRVGLVALAGEPGRLLPLMLSALRNEAEVTLCVEVEHLDLPSRVEIRGLDACAEVLTWADYAAVDLESEQIDELGTLLQIKDRARRALSAQALVNAPMPCSGSGRCGVCAVATARGELLPCEDGPVFSLGTLLT
jgi:hypothetical protein